MPSTYTLISSNVLTSSAASVTFSAIPSTYTDLVIRWSGSWSTNGTPNIYCEFNSDTSNNYSAVILYGYGSAAGSNIQSNQARAVSGILNSSTATANTFASGEIYIPSYLASANKPFSAYAVTENNSAGTDVIIQPNAALWRNTAAITSIKITPQSANFVSGSSFYLYGIKNS